MNRNYPKALLLLGVLGSLTVSAVGQVNPLPFPPPLPGSTTTTDWVALCIDPTSTTSPYSTDYGIEYQYDSLFGAVMGVSGTVNYSKYCFGPSGVTLPVAGRLGFFVGTDPYPQLSNGLANPNYETGGSTQDNLAGTVIDDALGLTFGTYTGVAGNFSIAKFYAGTPGSTTYQSSYFGSTAIQNAWWGASDRYFYLSSTNSGFATSVRVDVLGDAARCDWKMTNTGTAVATVGMAFGQWVLFSGVQGTHTADYVTVPGIKPLSTDVRFQNNADPNSGPLNNAPQLAMPPYLNYGIYQSWAYGLQIVTQPSAQVPDQTAVDVLDVGKNGFLLGSMTASDGALPDVLLGDTPFLNGEDAYVERWAPTTVPIGGTREIVAYYRSTWSTSDYAKPYSVVLDAPPVIATTSGQPNAFQLLTSTTPGFGGNLNYFNITVSIDDTRGFSTNDQSVPLEGVEVDLDLPPGMTDFNNGTNHSVKFLGQVPPQTVEHLTFQVAIDPTLFGNQTYNITVKPNPGPTKVLTGSITVASQPYLNLTGTANLVTAPWQFQSSDWSTILNSSGLVLDQNYQVFGWDPVSQDYILQTDPQRGFGSFIVTTQNVGYVPLGGTPSQVSDLQTGAPQIILQPGWNLVANPYNYAIPLGQLVGVPEADNSNAYTFTQLANLGFVSGALAYWDNLTQSYAYTSTFSDPIQPNTGYWLYVQSNQPVTINFPPVFQAFLPGLTDGYNNTPPKKSSKNGLVTPSLNWALQLTARSNGMIDSKTAIGQTNTAIDAKVLTRFKAPIAPVKKAISSSILVTSGNKTVQLSQALVAKTVTSQTWTWRVFTKVAGPVTLSWPNISSLPSNTSVKLVDPSTKSTVDLRGASTYTFEAGAQSAKDLQLVVQIGVAKPVIENFSSSLTRSLASFSYTLSVAGTSSVKVTQNGAVVASLVTNRSDKAGVSNASWNFLDAANRRVKPGVYQVVLTSTPSGGSTASKTLSITVGR